MAAMPPAAPPMRLFGLEPLRAALEYAGMRRMRRSELPRGDGHPIVIFPGLASDARATAPLRSFCEELGYAAYDWGRGLNTGPSGDVETWLQTLTDDVRAMLAGHLDGVTLLGWSLGGIYAREVAKRLGGRVRHVITIGTPFAGEARHTRAGLLYRLLNGRPARLDPAWMARLRMPPPVPTTSIYSRSDGVVAWQACVQPGNARHTENIEVDSSHCGMIWNPAVLAVLADRLRQPLRGWKRFRAAS
ncbi:esterase/lipase family protein [Roseateles violae]|uniref:Alpha/beta fold hydrolase n=1 Tax=Roseateles violae TaxID=3058042 RepID=A0ABT8DP33_9BURK|nr:alpha/beta fold hydrolase [Pelomonas sp. PFR6]MDN3920110.1 alpha/beta fold hydrolase [Pelomonas sp. PFR6]